MAEGHAWAGPGQELGHRGGQEGSLLRLQVLPWAAGKLKGFKDVLG